MTRKTLFIGAGHTVKKLIKAPWLEEQEEEEKIITLDIAEECKPDIEYDLDFLAVGGSLPFEDEELEQIHAYEVLEHFGSQGDWRGFFKEWTEFHRILKEGGCFFGTVPLPGTQQWGDPGHMRSLNEVSFSFLDQNLCRYEIETGIPRTDYSSVWKGNMVKIYAEENQKGGRLAFALQKQPVLDYNKWKEMHTPQ
jgi:hypothetical protein